MAIASGQWPNLTPTGNPPWTPLTVEGMGSTAGILVGSLVFASGYLPPDTLVQSVDSSSQITLTQNATAAGTGVILNIGNEPVTLAQAKSHRCVERTYEDPPRRLDDRRGEADRRDAPWPAARQPDDRLLG